MAGALDGIRVLDMTQIMAGPFCGMLLADLGADVIKIEKPTGDDSRRMGHLINGESAAFLSLNRNKRGIVVDVQTPEGKNVLWELIATADVLIENFRPGTMERLGFGFETVHARHPGLVYASVSGFGQTGPYRDKGGFDLVAQGMSGVLSVTGTPGTPSKIGVPIADLNAGLYASHAILAALIARGRSGEGQYVETSLLEAALSYTVWESNEYWVTGQVPERLGTAHRASAPYQVFPTCDGFVAVGAANQRTWERLATAIHREDLLQAPRFATNRDRMEHLDELVETLTTTFQTDNTQAWLAKLEESGVPAGPVLTIDEVYQDEQVQARAMDLEMVHPVAGVVHTIGFPVKYSSTPGTLRRPAPVLGQHTFEVLSSIGMSRDICTALANRRMIVDSGLAAPADGNVP